MTATSTPTPPPTAEIAETPSTSAATLDNLEPETDRETRPGLKRLALTLTVLFSFLLGLPFLYRSVEIYRSFREIDDLSAAVESNSLQFPCKFRAVFVGTGGSSFTANELSAKIEHHMRNIATKDSISCGGCIYNSSVSVVLESGTDCFSSDNDFSWKCGALSELNTYEDGREYDDQLFDEYLHSILDVTGSRISDGKVYTVIVVRREEHKDVNAVIGKYRHGWIVGTVSEEESVKKVADVFVKAFVNGGKEEGSITGEFMPVGADGKMVLSFNLLNAEPRDGLMTGIELI